VVATEDVGTLEIVKPAIADRNVTFKFTPKHFSESHMVYLYYHPSMDNVSINSVHKDRDRKNILITAVIQKDKNNKHVCVKYNNNQCGATVVLDLKGRCSSV